MVETTANYFPKMTNLLKEICQDIAKNIIKEKQPIVLVDGFEWYREVFSLLAKQVNLCKSTQLLLENGMEQEAYLLARSQFNNMLWIKYICEGEDNSKVKEYLYQPYISQINTCKNIKRMIAEYSGKLDDIFPDTTITEQLDRKIDENTKILEQEKIPCKIKSIAELAKQDEILFGLYVTFYNEGSKFEHSDISKTKLYCKQATEGYNLEQVFIFDLGQSDKTCWISVFKYSFMSIYLAFDSLFDKIINKEEHFLSNTEYGKAIYTKKDFQSILRKMNICGKMIDECLM